ncbi:hypothetical protein HY212_07260 [Candidatus Pacearchaeota archaeon]|nr:hypothetical protein [Candidatus Pacearchaeota archaeon]
MEIEVAIESKTVGFDAIFIRGNESLQEIIQKRVWTRVLKNRPSAMKRENQKKPRGFF